MCGLIGIVSVESRSDTALIRRAIADLRHRGPDASSVRSLVAPRGYCTLGHTRLRVVDLALESDQPLTNEDGSVWVAYNGELYNHGELRFELERAGHVFRSRSDTEVLVHLYEEANGDSLAMLEQLRGMFAFALFDLHRSRLLLARDRLGIKPLYWTQAGSAIAFASEVRALARSGLVGSDPNLSAFSSYLYWGCVPGPQTVFDKILELPPGSCLVWDGGTHKIRRWWTPTLGTEASGEGSADRDVADVLRDSVRRHLVADRPVGVFLSGGVDSAAITTLASEASSVRALTVTFTDAPEDEGEAAEAIARQTGAEHDRVPVGAFDVAQALPEILRSMDQPTSDGVNTWLVCRAARQAGLVVALSGLGGDELFAGYPSFELVPRVASLLRFSRWLPDSFRLAAARLVSARSPGSPASRVLTSAPDYAGAYMAVRGLFGRADFAGQANVVLEPSNCDIDDIRDLDAIGRVTVLELKRYMVNQLLRDTDQMSMAHSLEVRVPLLDDRVVAQVLALGSSVRAEAGKALLARAAKLRDCPPKRPFALPFRTWISGPLRAVVRDALLSEQLPFGSLVSSRLRHRIWDGFESGRVHWSRPWSIAVLRLWPDANGFRW